MSEKVKKREPISIALLFILLTVFAICSLSIFHIPQKNTSVAHEVLFCEALNQGITHLYFSDSNDTHIDSETEEDEYHRIFRPVSYTLIKQSSYNSISGQSYAYFSAHCGRIAEFLHLRL